MTGYYARELSGERLRRCYEIAPPRVRQYLQTEIEHTLSRITPRDHVLELGCGYGRLLGELAGTGATVTGVDSDPAMLRLAEERRSALPAAASSRIRLRLGDMTTFRRGEKFDRVLVPFKGLYCLSSLSV